MASRIVTSPAGERIEVVSDEDWYKLTDSTWEGVRQWWGRKASKPFIIMELWLGGKVEERKGGRASNMLYEAMLARFPNEIEFPQGSIAHIMQAGINAPAFERVTNGKRTYEIKMVSLPETWFRKMNEGLKERGLPRKDTKVIAKPSHVANITNESDAFEHPQSSYVAPIDQVGTPIGEQLVDMDSGPPLTDDDFDNMIRDMDLDAPTIYDIQPPLELSVASQVAMSLLTTVVEIITAGSGEAVDERVRVLNGQLQEVMTKLAARLTENDTYRRQLREAGDQIIALRTERDGLRSRLRATEANLTAALKGDAAIAVNGEIMRRVDEVMRVAPSTKKGAD